MPAAAAAFQAGQGFEGDMLKLTNYTAAMATVLEAVRDAPGGRPFELLRKESLAGECVGVWVTGGTREADSAASSQG